ncbi:MAG: universal stress protein [Porphyrobacter sp.]|nr:universal stress protein [Porphyrobacter sp.]
MYRHILIATDGSDIAQKGVDHGLAVAKAFGARVTVVAVAESQLPYLAAVADVSVFESQEHAAVQRAISEKILTAVSDEARAASVKVDTVCLENVSPAEAIVETARTLGCDLITLSSHGRRGLPRMILGSVASEVLVLSSVPVLVVR